MEAVDAFVDAERTKALTGGRTVAMLNERDRRSMEQQEGEKQR